MWKSGVSLCIVCFLPGLFWSLATAEDGLIPNGDFEEAPPPGAMVGNVIVAPNSLPKWETKGVVEYVSASSQDNNNNNTVLNLVLPKNGSAVRLGNGGKVSQRIQGLKKESLYSLSFSAGSTCPETQSLNVTVVSYEPQFVPMERSRLNSYAWTFTAMHDTHQLIFRNPDKNLQHPNCGPLIDGVGIKELSKNYERVRPEDIKENMLWNGDFEVGPSDFLNGTNGILVYPEHNNFYSLESPLPAWRIASVKPAKYIDSAHFRVPQGSRAVELVESVLYQSRFVQYGAKHRLSFAVGDAGNGCKGAMVVEASNGEEKFRVPYMSNGTGGFTTATFEYVNRHWDTTRIAFRSEFIGRDNSGAPCGPVLDDVKLVPLL